MAELDKYREHLARMGLGELVNELLELKMAQEPDSPKARVLHVQKQREVQLQLNKREVVEDGKAVESRSTRIRSLKNIL